MLCRQAEFKSAVLAREWLSLQTSLRQTLRDLLVHAGLDLPQELLMILVVSSQRSLNHGLSGISAHAADVNCRQCLLLCSSCREEEEDKFYCLQLLFNYFTAQTW